MIHINMETKHIKKQTKQKITSLSLVNLPPNSPLGLRNWTTNYHI